MIKGLEGILLGSQHPDELAKFYRETVGLKQTMAAEIGEKGEGLFIFEMKGSTALYVIHHSKVTGKNKEAGRFIFNLEVDNIENEVKRLKGAGVKVIQDTYHVEDYGYVATFEDSDGNYFQLVKTKE